MNYRHAFHAGNFADVFKHAVLVGLLDALATKPTPFCYIDTHAGAGRYDLRDDSAQKTGEAAEGIQRLLAATSLPASLRPYFDLVREINTSADGHLRYYPGSPLIAQRRLRENDRAVLCEVQQDEVQTLRTLFAGDRRIGVHERDGYAALPGFVPPKERRGVVLIDPPFEAQHAEFDAIMHALLQAHLRWPTGVFAVWYPIKLGRALLRFHRWFATNRLRKVLLTEFLLHPDDSPLRLNGCGMVIVNAPWQFDAWAATLGRDLTSVLHSDAPKPSRVEWLTGE